MKIYLTDQGDSSVGLGANVVEIEWNTGYPDSYTRETDRENFAKMFKEYFDTCGRVSVLFGDECAECGAVKGEDLRCPSCMLEVL